MSSWADLGNVVSGKEHKQLGPVAAVRRLLAGQLGGKGIEVHGSSVAPATQTYKGTVEWDVFSRDQWLSAQANGTKLSRYSVCILNQVLEQAVEPLAFLKGVQNLLAIGSPLLILSSQLRPASNSTLWNITPLGMLELARSASIKVNEFRAGIDGPALIERTYAGNPKETAKFISDESPLNQEIESQLTAEGKHSRAINIRKLQYCGLFVTFAESA